jgi:glycosyltransferase involved in cell wall biosynthesis
MNQPELTVVIPTYNRLDTLVHVIPSLMGQDLRAERYEVVVADSMSTDGTADYLAETAKQYPRLRHLPGPYNGRAMARNAGLGAARGTVVLFTDADIIASPDLLSRHLAHHTSSAWNGKSRRLRNTSACARIRASGVRCIRIHAGDFPGCIS